ncbi:hypothetical protein FB565_008061 [Actinoplanes lutulentus]|uniref:Uncharacterized protein n=1 Tax=Actinoplanes lutulentus TaxID=1287878 RepID=A0A327Z548_9ACTN|nr:hypothetical protein [Actinoplanes lutulentus]MBB2948278.1 hypothetical protein [Actinoplanes lutulentus]RAK31225.1 hypothetical protein B0I29_11531 [Actinoplanes lutulentus]
MTGPVKPSFVLVEGDASMVCEGDVCAVPVPPEKSATPKSDATTETSTPEPASAAS